MSYAVSKKYIPDNPVKGVQRVRKAATTRRGLTHSQVEEVMKVAQSGGNDPILDYLLLWTLLETAARIGGLLKLRRGDIRIEEGRCTLDLHEKRDTQRAQPITKAFHDTLLELASSRGSVLPTDPVFRYHPNAQGRGNPMQAKRFEILWKRIRKELAWAEEKGVSSHWIRRTTVTWIDRAFNSTMAQAFAGHTPASVTAGYSIPTPEELAATHAALTGTLVDGKQVS
jgi:integrase